MEDIKETVDTKNPDEIVDAYIDKIMAKVEQGFTYEQIAKDLGMPEESVRRYAEANKMGDEIIDKNTKSEVIKRDENGKPIVGKYKFDEKDSEDEEKLDVKDMYTLEEAIKDLESDDDRKRCKAEYSIIKIIKCKLETRLDNVSKKKDTFITDYRLHLTKLDALSILLNQLGQEMDYFSLIDKYKYELQKQAEEAVESENEAEFDAMNESVEENKEEVEEDK